MANGNPIRIIIDTNLWISFIISHRLSGLEDLLYSGNFRLLFSAELVDEIVATIRKPKLKKHFKKDALEDMLWVFDPFIDFVTVKSAVSICRDPKDNFLLSLAKDGLAHYLVTGDQDLLSLDTIEETKIITFNEFITREANDS